MTTNKMPAVVSGGRMTGSEQPSCHPHDITAPSAGQLETLQQLAQDAKQAGDYSGFCRLRRAFLLAQAESYSVGGRR